MTTRRKRTILVAIGVLATLCVGLIGSLGTLAVEVIKGINIIDEPSFIFENGNDKYRCYITDTNNLEISIGWGKGASETPRDLIVPDTMYNGETAYTVKGIVQGGFRSCDFETIKLPTTMNIIEEEAFAYCDKLKTFTLPYGITEIKASTFIDCRSMVHFLYYNEDGIVDTINEQITSIGSHAFDSCVRLLDFSFPTKIQTIGECAFQKCSSFTRIYLPSKIMDGSTVTNNFTIGKYAFADCTKLEFVYFEKNLTSVGSYAFVDCLNSMILHYGNETKPKTPAFSTNWRKKILDTGDNKVYSIESSYIIIRQVHKYPGLRFSIETGKDILIDCSRDNTPNRIVLDSTKAAYAAIYQWNAPADKGVRYEDYYDPESKALEIPGEVTVDNVTYPVKVINKAAFANKPDDISSVKFNSGLIQICKEAFLKDTGIENLDFSECNTLLEISNDVFNQRNGTRNSHVDHLSLPSSLEYLGMYAFWAFDKVTTLSFTTNSNKPHLKVMGGACFGELGFDNGGVGIEVTLPGSLDDDAAKAANINYARNSDYNEQNWAAIGPYVFGSPTRSDSVTSRVTVVTMDQDPTPDLKCSLAPNAMNRARKLVKFVANKNLAMVGSEVFKNCNDLREVFLTTAGGKALAEDGMLYPWGTKAEDGSTYESSILSSGGDGVKPDLVLYLDGPAPGKISTNEMTDVKVKWNSETAKTYNTEFGYSTISDKDIYHQSRSSNPTFLNVDFDFSHGSLLYWKPNTTAPNYGSFVSAPKNLDEYNAGIIALVRNSDGKYVVARYFSSTSYVVDEINLTNMNHIDFGNISNKIVEIGDEAFAVNGASKKGYYFVLPHTVTKIDERAFFRKIDANAGTSITTSGVRIVTYKNSSGVIQPSQAAYEEARDRCINAGSTLGNIYGYCDLPSGLTDIGRFAFYSNVFQSVNIPNTVTYFGVGAFYAHDANKATQHSRLTDITFENSHFKTINHGIYYVGSDTGKTLLYQTQNISGELTIDENTEAIGLAACANTKYTKINLNEGLRIIYGSAFEYNYALTEVTGGEDLEYISAIAHDSNDEVYQDNTHYENIDYRDYYAGDYDIRASRKTAFKNCTSLKTFNFKKLTSLIKIGQGAFYGCNALEELTGGDAYHYYKADSNGNIGSTPTTSLTKGVLDLSPCTNLRVIGANAFTTKKVPYVHLPYTNGELSVARDKADDFILDGNDAEQVIFNNTNPIYLVGDVADKTYRGNDSITHVDKDKWSNKWYGNDRNKVYFHAFSASDILNGNTEGSVHYWIKHPTDENGYILCDSKAIADKYFANH